jgi:hypothetical protein
MFHSQVFNVSRCAVALCSGASFPRTGRRKDRDPFLDVGADEVGEFFRRAPKGIGTLPL